MALSNYFQNAPSGGDTGQLLQLQITEFIGINTESVAALDTIGVTTVFDLASSPLFNLAEIISRVTESSLDKLSGDTLDSGVQLAVGQLPGDLPLSSLRMLTQQSADALQDSLDVQTIGHFANWPFRKIATEILSVSVGATVQDRAELDAERLRPRLGEFPTESVYYDTLYMLGTTGEPNAQAMEAPLSLQNLVGDGAEFSDIAIGSLATYSQSWFVKGLTLGHMLHSLALAPGEATRIAVVDWSRRSRAASKEAIDENETLDNSQDHSRSVSEVQNAVANELQSGGSIAAGWSKSTSKSKGVAGSIGGGLAGFIGGAAGAVGISIGGSYTKQESETNSSAQSASWSVGSRSVMAEMTQKVNDRTEQHANSARNRRASAVREVSQDEHEEISTRIVANYNHMHALTIQYYEVIQIYEIITKLHSFNRVLFLPFSVLDFTGPDAIDLVSQFRAQLLDAAINQRALSLLLDHEGIAEIRSSYRVPHPLLVNAATVSDGVMVAMDSAFLTPATSGTGPSGNTNSTGGALGPTESSGPLKSVTRAGQIAGHASGNAKLRSIAFEGVGVTTVLIEQDGSAVGNRTFVVPATNSTVDMTDDFPLKTLKGIRVARAGGGGIVGDMILDIENEGLTSSIVVPLALGPGTSMQKVAYVIADSADREAELLAHLQGNRAYYTQAIMRGLDSASLTLLMAGRSLNDRPLIDQVEPNVIAISGNYLVLRAPADEDAPSGLLDAQTWGELLEEREVVFDDGNKRSVSIPTGGVFAEAVLGRSNSAEKLDITRFWNWQDSPIPLQPPEISPVSAGSRAQAENLTPGQLSQPILNITTPTVLPDPSGLATSLNALATANMFRDQSGLSGTQTLAQTASSGTLTAATEAGRIASENYKVATEQATEMGKAAADMYKAVKAGGSSSEGRPGGSGGPGAGGISGDGAKINHAKDLDDRGQSPSGGQSKPKIINQKPTKIAGSSSSMEADTFEEVLSASPNIVGRIADGLTSVGGTVVDAIGSGIGTGIEAIRNIMDDAFTRQLEVDAAAAKAAGITEVDVGSRRLIPMRHHDNSADFKGMPVAFAAWTNNSQHLYINFDEFAAVAANGPDPQNLPLNQVQKTSYLKLFSLYVLRHELHHARQMDQENGGVHTTSFEQMIKFEEEAYSADVAWLTSNRADLEAITGISVAGLPSHIDLIDILMDSSNDASQTFNNLKTLVDEKQRQNALTLNDIHLPATLNGQKYIGVAPLYKTAPPP